MKKSIILLALLVLAAVALVFSFPKEEGLLIERSIGDFAFAGGSPDLASEASLVVGDVNKALEATYAGSTGSQAKVAVIAFNSPESALFAFEKFDGLIAESGATQANETIKTMFVSSKYLVMITVQDPAETAAAIINAYLQKFNFDKRKDY